MKASHNMIEAAHGEEREEVRRRTGEEGGREEGRKKYGIKRGKEGGKKGEGEERVN